MLEYKYWKGEAKCKQTVYLQTQSFLQQIKL